MLHNVGVYICVCSAKLNIIYGILYITYFDCARKQVDCLFGGTPDD
jgi:hypothetical protein